MANGYCPTWTEKDRELIKQFREEVDKLARKMLKDVQPDVIRAEYGPFKYDRWFKTE